MCRMATQKSVDARLAIEDSTRRELGLWTLGHRIATLEELEFNFIGPMQIVLVARVLTSKPDKLQNAIDDSSTHCRRPYLRKFGLVATHKNPVR